MSAGRGERWDVRALARAPMAWIALGLLLIRAVGIGWGLPASDGWDTDGIAPRDFLPGLAATFTPGSYFTYPPLHLALLALLTLPIVLVAVVRAPSRELADLIGELLKVPYMTSMAMVARVTSLAMSIGIVLFLARIAEEMRAYELELPPPAPSRRRLSNVLEGDWTDVRVRRVGWCCAAVAGLNASLTYYAHTTNLDVPYLFWAIWSLSVLTRAIARGRPDLLRRAFALAVFAVGTKDQAYALFILAVPIVLALWIGFDGWARERRGEVLATTAKALGAGVVLLAVVDAVVFNPTGFKARVAFLTGPASKDFVEYTNDWHGRFQIVLDAARLFDLQYPKILAAFIALGLLHAHVSVARAPSFRRGGQVALALLPALVAISFTVTFNWASLRSNARFLMPQALMLSIYAARAVDALFFGEQRALRWAGRAAVFVPFALAVHKCVSVDVNLLYDPRYAAEAWLRENVQPGETIETYGLNVYLPRFPAQAKVTRVGPEPVAKRNPLPPLTEIEAPFEQAPTRDARWVVLSYAWGWRYLVRPEPGEPGGHALAPTQVRTTTDKAATQWFDRLVTSSDAFKIAFDSRYEFDRWFPIVDVHGATGRPIWVYVRK